MSAEKVEFEHKFPHQFEDEGSFDRMEVVIFIPTYRNEHLIDMCVKSCLSQTYQQLKVVVVDNGASESGRALHAKLKLLGDQRVCYVANGSNIGSQNNFHLILSLVHPSKRFMVIPADQILTKNCVEKMVEAATDNPDANMVFPRQIVRDVKDSHLNHEVSVEELPQPWPHDGTKSVDSKIMIEYFFSHHNLDSEWTHFTFIGALIDGSIIRAMGISRAPLFDHGLEELLCLELLSFCQEVVLLDEPLLILYTNNERLGTASRPGNNYTRYEPVFAEYQFLELYEPLLIRRGFIISKLYLFVIFKTVYTLFRYPGPVILLIPKAINSVLKVTFLIFPLEILTKIKEYKSKTESKI